MASRSRLGLESRAEWLLPVEGLTETLATLISKLPRMQEADLKLAELMVLGVWTKRFQNLAGQTFLSMNFTPLLRILSYLQRNRPLVKNSLNKTYSALASVVLSPPPLPRPIL